MRVPLAVSIESRDGSVAKDARVLNGLIEVKGDKLDLRKRPGCADIGLVKAGIAQLLYFWNGIKTVQADYLNAGTIASITSPTQTALSPTNASQAFSAQDTGSNAATPRLMLQNRYQAWAVSQAGAVSGITLPVALGTHVISITSLTRVGTVATALTATDPAFAVGTSVTIAGATPAGYNGAQTVTAITPSSFTPGPSVAITITRSGTTATATTVGGVAHGLSTGTYTISGANESAYNGSKAITVTSVTQFTYTVTVGACTSFDASATFNGSDKAASITLSGGNLVASGSEALGVDGNVRATTSKSSGRWYWEMRTGTWSHAIGYFGAMTAGASLTGWPGGAGFAGIASGFDNTTYGVVLDLNQGTLSTWNGSVLSEFLTGISGTYYPFANVEGNNGAFTGTGSWTANFGGGAFAYTPPDDPPTTASGTIIVTGANIPVPASFTFTIGGSPTTPATGTITGTSTNRLVPGIAYINGYFNIMDEAGVFYTSNSDDPTTWGALTFQLAQNENGGGKAIAKSGSYLIGLKEWSTEFFYDAQKTVGSPFAPVDNGFTQVGCANGESVTQVGDSLLWVSQTRQHGRGVYRMDGLQQAKVSSPDVERILDAADLTTVYAFGLNLDGHPLYLLTVVESDLTLVYDLASKTWQQWTSMTLGSSKSVYSIICTGTTAIVMTATAHTVTDGSPVKISGANQSEYNGIFQARYLSPTAFAIEVAGSPTTPATGTILAYPYTESYFKFTQYANCGGLDLVLHESDGHLYQLLSTRYQDAGLPIDLMARSVGMDGGTDDKKKLARATVIGDKVSDIAMIRWSDDDYVTNSAYRVVDLNAERSKVRKGGSFRKRSFELKHIGNTPQRWEALQLTIGE